MKFQRRHANSNPLARYFTRGTRLERIVFFFFADNDAENCNLLGRTIGACKVDNRRVDCELKTLIYARMAYQNRLFLFFPSFFHHRVVKIESLDHKIVIIPLTLYGDSFLRSIQDKVQLCYRE